MVRSSRCIKVQSLSLSHVPHIALFLIAKSPLQTSVVDTVVVNSLNLLGVSTTVNRIPQNELEMVAVMVFLSKKVNPTDQQSVPGLADLDM